MAEENIAGESDKTQRARRKLEKKLQKIDENMNQRALDRTSKEIHRWIERRADERITLKNKSISLFDENQNPADLSRKVANLAQQIGEDLSTPLELLLEKNQTSIH